MIYLKREWTGEKKKKKGIQAYADVYVSLWSPQNNTNKITGSST